MKKSYVTTLRTSEEIETYLKDRANNELSNVNGVLNSILLKEMNKKEMNENE